MTNQWGIAQAKAQLSTVIRQAYDQRTPQIITHHGQGRVVVVHYDDWLNSQQPSGSLVDFLAQSPLCGSDLVLPPREHDDTHREVQF